MPIYVQHEVLGRIPDVFNAEAIWQAPGLALFSRRPLLRDLKCLSCDQPLTHGLPPEAGAHVPTNVMPSLPLSKAWMFAQTGGGAFLPPPASAGGAASARAPSPPGLPAVMNGHGSGAFSVLPNGQAGHMLLQMAASTGRLFANDGQGAPGAALKWGAPMPLDMHLTTDYIHPTRFVSMVMLQQLLSHFAAAPEPA